MRSFKISLGQNIKIFHYAFNYDIYTVDTMFKNKFIQIKIVVTYFYCGNYIIKYFQQKFIG